MTAASSLSSPPPLLTRFLVYEDVLKLVGDFGLWQLKTVLLLWIPMFMCGTQFVTTDFMVGEPRVLFCHNDLVGNCTTFSTPYNNSTTETNKLLQLFPPKDGGSVDKNIEHYKMIFPDVDKYFLPYGKGSARSHGSELVRSRQRSPYFTFPSSQNNRMNGNFPFCNRYEPDEVSDDHCSWTDEAKVKNKVVKCDVSREISYASGSYTEDSIIRQQSIVTEFNLVTLPSAQYR